MAGRPLSSNPPNAGAAALRDYRAREGLTQEAAAARNGVGQQTWSGWETTGRKPLGAREQAIVSAIGVSLDLFYQQFTPTGGQAGVSSSQTMAGALQSAPATFSGE